MLLAEKVGESAQGTASEFVHSLVALVCAVELRLAADDVAALDETEAGWGAPVFAQALPMQRQQNS